MLTTDRGKSLHILYVLCLNGAITCYISGVQSSNHHNGAHPPFNFLVWAPFLHLHSLVCSMQHGGITWRSRQCPMVILRCGDLRFLQYWNVCTASERIRARPMILSWVLLWLHLTVTCSHPHCYPDQFPVAWTLVHYIVVVLHRSPYKHLSSAIARHSRVELAGFNGVPTGSNNYSFD